MKKSGEIEYQSTSNGNYIVIGNFLPDSIINTDHPAKMQVYAVRVYNRGLSENEIHHNYILDKARYGIEE